jgi:hypothetical protein
MDTPERTENVAKPNGLPFSSYVRKGTIPGLDEPFASCSEQLQALQRLSERMKESMNRQAELLEKIQRHLDLKGRGAE